MSDEGFSATHLSLYEQNCWLMTCQTISSEDIVRDSNDLNGEM